MGLVAIVSVVLVRTFVVQAYSIPSESMVPQLKVGDRVLVSKLALRMHDPRRGDLIVFDCPQKAPCTKKSDSGAIGWVLEALGVRPPSTDEYVKRVVALAGETVQARGGELYIDGRRLIEPYLPSGTTTSDFGPTTVSKGELWVMGDNRDRSLDSRTFGTIKTDTVVGRAVARFWPLNRPAFL